MKFCKKLTCTNLIENDKVYCSLHIPVKCIFPQCEKLTLYITGLCEKHHIKACALVEQKKATWKELKQNKKILLMPVHSSGE